MDASDLSKIRILRKVLRPLSIDEAMDLLLDKLLKYDGNAEFLAPPLEKMLADGAIIEWETDTYADSKDAPGTFLIAYLSATQEGLDKANKAVQETLKSRPMRCPAFEFPVDEAVGSDVVVRSYAVYK